MNEKANSPFTPGHPAPVDLFVGRVEQIEEVIRYFRQIEYGKQINVFLSGERGIGKSSLAKFLSHLANKDDNFLVIHVFLGGVTTLEEAIRRIFEQILKEFSSQSWSDKMSKFFDNYIKKHVQHVDLFGVSISFNPPLEDLEDLSRNFPEALDNILIGMKSSKSENPPKGIFIILDDIDGISKNPKFADWYKSFVDGVAIKYDYFPVLIMLVGLPEVRDILSNCQPSLLRVFRPIDIDKLLDDDVREFFTKSFNKVDMDVDSDAMRFMVRYSSGLPILMHEIGDATFWKTKGHQVAYNDATLGIIEAANNIGKKYLDPTVYRAIRSERYMSILRKLGNTLSTSFRKKELAEMLNVKEKNVLDNFLKRMRELGVIVPDVNGGRGSYKFVNELYPVYIMMESLGYNRKTKK
jgi:hypothetical protein